MNCPKCGFVQEERIDCLKCGIVFSKYYALNPMSRLNTVLSAEPAGEVAPPAPAHSAGDAGSGAPDVRQLVKDLQQQLSDSDFGRAERTRLRKEFRDFKDSVSQEVQAQATRLAQLEEGRADRASLRREFKELGDNLRAELRSQAARLSQVDENCRASIEARESVSPEDFIELEQELKDVYLRPLRDRLDSLEDRQRRLDAGGGVQAREAARKGTAEALAAFEKRLATLEEMAATFERHWSPEKMNGVLPRMEQGLSEIADLRSSLENVSVRYSEIGELKKNQLVVLNSLDSVRSGLESFKRQIADGFPRTLAELAREVAALRAEYRQLWTRLNPTGK